MGRAVPALLMVSVEVSLKESLKGLSVPCLIPCHLVNCIVNSIEAKFLCLLCEFCLACCGSELCIDELRIVWEGEE